MTPFTSRRDFLQRCSATTATLLAAGRGAGAWAAPASFAAAEGQSIAGGRGTSEAVPAVFTPLAPGAVEPRGWIRSWALRAANGITGHLDECTATFSEAWKGYGFEAMGARADGTGWPLEQCSYWLDGAIRLAYMLRDEALLQKITARLDMVVNGVLNGGETFIYWLPKSVVSDSFNSWAHSHMGRALVAYYQGSSDPRVLAALTKVYRSYPLDDLPPTFYGVSGAVNVDAMSDTYRMSGDRAILENLLAFAKRSSYISTVDSWQNNQLMPGHNVIFYEHIRTPSILYQWTGNHADLQATTAGLKWNDDNFLLPVGISSGEEYQAGVGATRNIETCNVSASIWTNLCVGKITGNSACFDRIERIFFNAGPEPVGRDFKIMSYYQRPNRYSRELPAQEPTNPGKGCYQFTDIGDPVLCCVGNLNRVIPNYVMHMWMSSPDGGIAATLYGPCRVATTVGNVRVKIDCNTVYPFGETIEFVVSPERETRFPLHLRIPSWSEHPSILVNGRPAQTEQRYPGFQSLVRDWKAGDTVQLRLPMQVRVQKGYETPYPQIPYFKGSREIAQIKEIHNPYASVFLGPLLFALPIPDRSPNEEFPGTKINYALDVEAERPGLGEAQVFRDASHSYDDWAWTLASPLQLGINAQEIAWTPTENQPLPRQFMTGTPTRIVLVPYGCTKFGISMFPRTS